VEDHYDILVKKEQDLVRIYHANGALIDKLPSFHSSKLLKRIGRQAVLNELINFSNPNQRFNVFMDLIPSKGVLTEGEWLSFTVRSEADAYILLLNIDPGGLISVIHPFKEIDLTHIMKADEEFPFRKLGQVRGPFFGTEYLKLFAFKKQPYQMRRLRGLTQFSPEDPAFKVLMGMLRRADNYAQATLQLKTCAKSDIVN